MNAKKFYMHVAKLKSETYFHINNLPYFFTHPPKRYGMDQIKKFSPAAFVIVIFCFFLPFVNITCGGQKIVSLTGIQLVTGSEIKPQGMFNQKDSPEDIIGKNKDMLKTNENVDPQPMALLALIMAAAALGLSFVRKKIMALISMIASVLGAAFMLLLKANLDSDLPSEAQMVIDAEFQIWYWLALIMFIAGAVLQWLNFRDEGDDTPVTIDGLPQS